MARPLCRPDHGRARNLYGTTEFGGGPGRFLRSRRRRGVRADAERGRRKVGGDGNLQLLFTRWEEMHRWRGSSRRLDCGRVGQPLWHDDIWRHSSTAGHVADLGTAFELTPEQASGTWTETLLQSFCAPNTANCTAGAFPAGALVMDELSGNLYGLTAYGGANSGPGELAEARSSSSSRSGRWGREVSGAPQRSGALWFDADLRRAHLQQLG